MLISRDRISSAAVASTSTVEYRKMLAFSFASVIESHPPRRRLASTSTAATSPCEYEYRCAEYEHEVSLAFSGSGQLSRKLHQSSATRRRERGPNEWTRIHLTVLTTRAQRSGTRTRNRRTFAGGYDEADLARFYQSAKC